MKHLVNITPQAYVEARDTRLAKGLATFAHPTIPRAHSIMHIQSGKRIITTWFKSRAAARRALQLIAAARLLDWSKSGDDVRAEMRQDDNYPRYRALCAEFCLGRDVANVY